MESHLEINPQHDDGGCENNPEIFILMILYLAELLYSGWDKEVDIANGPSYFPMRSSLSFNTNNVAIDTTWKNN